MNVTTVYEKTVSGVESTVTILSGDYAIAPDPLIDTEGGDTSNVTSIDQATLDASYTPV